MRRLILAVASLMLALGLIAVPAAKPVLAEQYPPREAFFSLDLDFNLLLGFSLSIRVGGFAEGLPVTIRCNRHLGLRETAIADADGTVDLTAALADAGRGTYEVTASGTSPDGPLKTTSSFTIPHQPAALIGLAMASMQP
jgi:hypothetical protein